MTEIHGLLGEEAPGLLGHVCQGIPRSLLHLPGPDFVDRVFIQTDRPDKVLGNRSWLFGTGRLAGTGYLSLLPVDQGIEHSAGASFAPNPIYFDPEIHRALKLKALETSRSITDLVNQAVKEALAEDAEDILACEERENEPLISYDQMVKKLRKDGRI